MIKLGHDLWTWGVCGGFYILINKLAVSSKNSTKMKASDEKSRQKELLNDYKKREKQVFIKSLPFAKEHFIGLFDFLNNKLSDEGCEHTLRFTEEYLNDEGLYAEEVIEFLEENGGYCDCEILANVEEKFEGL